MNTIDRAADVIRAHGFDPCREPECIAQDLADAGLLAPDLSKGNGDVFLEDGDCEVSASKGSHKVRLHIEDPRLTSEEAREVAHALLAAADYSEANRD